MGAQESTEEAPDTLEDGQSESKEELTTPTRFRRRSRSEPPDPRAAEALSPAAIDLRLDEARSPANVDPRLRPPARVRTASTLDLFPDDAYAESVCEVLCSKFVVAHCVEIRSQAHNAIDATVSPWLRHGVEIPCQDATSPP